MEAIALVMDKLKNKEAIDPKLFHDIGSEFAPVFAKESGSKLEDIKVEVAFSTDLRGIRIIILTNMGDGTYAEIADCEYTLK